MGWEDFSQHTQFEIGVGNRVRFWHNCWCGDQPLQVKLPVLYVIAINKEAFVALSLTRQRKGGRTWDVRFTRDLNDWKVGSMVDFLHILEYNTPSSDNGDRLRWTLKKNGNFDIRSHYNALQGSFVIFPWKGIWEVKDPRRVSCFVWTAAWNKVSWNNILISDNMVTI